MWGVPHIEQINIGALGPQAGQANPKGEEKTGIGTWGIKVPPHQSGPIWPQKLHPTYNIGLYI
jgi:hypothetical protein